MFLDLFFFSLLVLGCFDCVGVRLCCMGRGVLAWCLVFRVFWLSVVGFGYFFGGIVVEILVCGFLASVVLLVRFFVLAGFLRVVVLLVVALFGSLFSLSLLFFVLWWCSVCLWVCVFFRLRLVLRCCVCI